MQAQPIRTSLDETEAFGRPAPDRRILPVLVIVLRFAALTLPFLLLRAAFWPRDCGAAELTDRQLADIGLTRADVERPRDRERRRP